jgi:HlyD family secretion protein
MNRRWLLRTGTVASVVLLSVGGWLGFRSSTSADPDSTVRVERGTVRRSVVASGVIQPFRKVEVKSKVNGIIQRLPVDVGDPIRVDSPLAELDRETLEARVREAASGLRAAEAEGEGAEAALVRARKESESGELELARSRVERLRRLAQDGLLAQADLEEAERTFREARRNDDVRQANVALARAASRQAKAKVGEARAVYDRTQEELRNSVLRSSIDGIVLSRPVEVGSAVSSILNQGASATLVMVVGDTSQVYFDGSVDEADVPYLKPGAPALVTIAGLRNRSFPGKVTRVAPSGERVNSAGRFAIQVSISNREAVLKPNMTANAEIVLEERTGVLVVPESVVAYQPDGRAFVEVASRQGGRRKVEVALGISDAVKVEVVRPLSEGDLVYRRP